MLVSYYDSDLPMISVHICDLWWT